MSTVAPTKTHFATTWTADRIQSEAARAFARNMKTTMSVLEKLGPDAVAEYQKAMVAMKIEMFKQQGVKNPLELAQHMAEHEANLLGSRINVWGDEKTAHLEYEVCGCFNAMKDEFKATEADMQRMGQMFQSKTEAIAKAFGFKGEVKFGASCSEPKAIITFSR